MGFADTTPILRARHIRKTFSYTNVLRDVSLDLYAGEVVVLEGANGSGKTTLLNILSGLIKPDGGAVNASVRTTRTWQNARLFSSLSAVENVEVAYPDRAGERLLAGVFRPNRHRCERQQSRSRALLGLAEVGAADLATRSAAVLSVGEARRIAIMRAVATDATILLLDEPLAGLDRDGRDQVITLLKTIAGQGDRCIVIVEHGENAADVAHVATRKLLLRGGVLHDQTSRASDMKDPGFGSTDAASGLNTLSSGAQLHVCADEGNEGTSLVLEEVVFAPRSKNIHFQQGPVSFALPANGVAVLKAPNGWGKTTLLETIMGFGSILRGSLTVDGNPVGDLEPFQRVRKVGLRYTRAVRAGYPTLTIDEYRRLSRVSLPAWTTFARRTRFESLSGGEQKRLVLACALADPNLRIALLDEPFAGIDDKAATAIRLDIKAASRRAAILIVEPLSH